MIFVPIYGILSAVFRSVYMSNMAFDFALHFLVCIWRKKSVPAVLLCPCGISRSIESVLGWVIPWVSLGWFWKAWVIPQVPEWSCRTHFAKWKIMTWHFKVAPEPLSAVAHLALQRLSRSTHGIWCVLRPRSWQTTLLPQCVHYRSHLIATGWWQTSPGFYVGGLLIPFFHRSWCLC